MISVMEKTFDSDDGKFLRWKHIPHKNLKQIHDTSEYLKNECHSLFNQWKRKGVESILFDEANKQTGGHFENNFNQGNMDDDVSIGSEMLLPADLEPQQATLPQMATRNNPFPHQLPQHGGVNVEEASHRNESLEAENSEEDEEHDFGQWNNDYNEFIADDPFMNPEIDGHVWQVNERSNKGCFLNCELQSEYFRSKTAVSIELMTYINENDMVLVGERTVGGRIKMIIDEAFHAFTHHRSKTDGSVLFWRRKTGRKKGGRGKKSGKKKRINNNQTHIINFIPPPISSTPPLSLPPQSSAICLRL
jgi:hypothetical protein